MLFGLLGIWLGALAILLSGFFYTRAMFAGLREQALTPAPPLPKTGRGGTRSPKPKDSPLPVFGRGAGGEGLRGAGGEGLPSERLTSLGRRFFYLGMAGALLAA